jgi:hypothetical protein
MIKFININVNIYKNDDLKIIDKKERKKIDKTRSKNYKSIIFALKFININYS